MKTIIFDFDGTIADTFQFAPELIGVLAPRFGYKPLTTEEINELRNKSMKEIVNDLKIPRFKLAKFVSEARNELAKNMDKVEAFPGIRETLDELKRMGIILVVISSNSEENIRKFLNAKQINCFREVISEKRLFGKSKTIKRYIKQHKLNRDDVLMVGDEVRDFEAAKKAKINCICVSWGYNKRLALESKGCKVVDTPKELLRILK